MNLCCLFFLLRQAFIAIAGVVVGTSTVSAGFLGGSAIALGARVGFPFAFILTVSACAFACTLTFAFVGSGRVGVGRVRVVFTWGPVSATSSSLPGGSFSFVAFVAGSVTQ